MLFKKIFSRGVSKKTEEAVGLDIGNFNLKVAHLKKTSDKFSLRGFGFCRINSKDRNDIIAAIKKTTQEAHINTKKVNASVSPEGVIVRYLLLPEMTADELIKAMSFEIERYVPFRKEEVVSDYMILSSEGESKKNLKILLVAAKKEFVEDRTNLIYEAGLEPQLITIDSLVIKNSFQINYPDRANTTVGLLNIGSKMTNISIVRNNLSYFMRDVQIGGDNITYLIKERLDIDEPAAESKKFNLAQNNQELIKVIEPVLGNLLNEIYLSFDYYESEFGLTVDEIYVSGGSSKLCFVMEFLKKNLGREIFLLDSMKNLDLAPDLSSDKLRSLSPFLPVSIGLASESFL